MTRLIDITGKALSGEWGSDDDVGTGIPVLRTTNFTNEGIIDFSNVVTRIIEKKRIDGKFLRPGDIIIEKSGGSDKQPVGRVVFYEGPEKSFLFNNFTGLLRVKNTDKWVPKYVFYSLFSRYWAGGTRPFENRTTGLHNLQTDAYVNATDIPDVPPEKQCHVCRILDSIRLVLSLRNQQLSSLDTLVKARFVEMFGDPHENPRATYLPLGKLSKVVSGGTPSRQKKEYWEQGTIPWVKTAEIRNAILDETEEHITAKGLAESSAQIVPANTVLIAMYGQGKTRGMTAFLDIPAATNQACACLLPTEKIDMKYLWQFLMLSYDKLRSLAQGGTQPNLNANMIKSFPIMIPPRAQQDAFVRFVAQVERTKATIRASLAETQRLFDSLMQEYFG